MEKGDGVGWRREGRYLLELIGVTAVTVAQPVFNVIQQAPEELVSLRAGPTEIVAYAVLLVLGPPLVLWLIEQPFRLLGPTVRGGVHAGILGFGVGLFVIEIVKSGLLDAEGRTWLLFVGFAVAAGATWAVPADGEGPRRSCATSPWRRRCSSACSSSLRRWRTSSCPAVSIPSTPRWPNPSRSW